MLRYSLKWAAAAVAAQVAVVVLSPFTLQTRLAQAALTQTHWAALAVFLLCLYRERFLAGSARARRVAACAALVFWSLLGLEIVFELVLSLLPGQVVIKSGTSTPVALILLQYAAWVAFLTVFVKMQVEAGSSFVRWLAAVLAAVTAVRGLLLLYSEVAREIRYWPIAGWDHPTFATFWYSALTPVVLAFGWIPLAAFLFASWRPAGQPRSSVD